MDYPCICGNLEDILIAEKYRYGIPLNIYLCKNCGTIRSGEVLDRESLIRFYEGDYSKIYVNIPPMLGLNPNFRKGRSLFDYLRIWEY